MYGVRRKNFRRPLLLLFIVMLTASLAMAQDDDSEARVINDEGGPVVITGEVTYTNPFFTSGVAAPVIILEDQAGFIDRNENFIFPPESQTLGQITSNFYESPFTYSLALPIEPQGTLRDVDNDTQNDTGVMVFAIAYWNNVWGDPFLEERDLQGGGWSGAYASTEVSTDPNMRLEIIGGKFLIFAPDDEQGFPSGFGEDGLLFTEDDPIVSIPAGYSVVDLDEEPFTFNRSREQAIDLIEPDSAALVDFSDLSFIEAFDEMVDMVSKEYAFTEAKDIDWDALYEQYRPRFEEAEDENDDQLYLEALRDFLYEIPDGHIAISPLTPFVEEFQFEVALGIGAGIRETDDGRAIVTYLLTNGPAEDAGIELGAEILEIDGEPIEEVISAQDPVLQTFSTPHNLRLEQQRYAMRFNADTTEVEITYQNPEADEPVTVTMEPVAEGQSYAAMSIDPPLTGLELPVEYEILPSGYGYASIHSFLDNEVLTIQLWERMIQEMQENNVPGIIIDMRRNGGGNPFLADQMTAYFFDESLVTGGRGRYSEEIDDFFFDPRADSRLYLPAEDLRYLEEVAVLVGPNCASACERFAYNFTIDDRGLVVGQYPTAGLGGGVTDFRMPLDVTVRYTVVRSVDVDGNIHIEGTGVEPTLKVPINEATLLSEGDPVLEFALAALSGAELTDTNDRGEIALGDVKFGQFEPGFRDRYVFEIEGGVPFDVLLAGAEDETLTTVIRFYDTDGSLIFSNEDQQDADSGATRLEGLGTDASFTAVIEVGTYEDSLEGPYVLRISPSNQ
jgi:C-terminal processing protease CtpA/Prc